MNWWRRLVLAVTPVKQIALVNLGEEPRPPKSEWLAYQARKAMGEKWCAHPTHRVLSDKQKAAIAEQRIKSVLQPDPNVRVFSRKKA